jgi:hypothetical protein
MSSNDIEHRLDRSLRKQVALPELDARFNASVWERIAEQEAPAAAAPRARGSRWLLASNVLGVAVSVGLIVYCIAHNFSGLSAEVNVPMPAIPEISAQTTAAVVNMLGWGVTVVSVAFGLAFTRMGRRLLQFLRSEFA